MDMETAVRELTPRLLRYCRGRTGEEALAEDIAQEALIALVTRWRRLGPPQSPVAFVFAIARRRAGRRLAKRRLRELFVRSQNGRRPAPSVAQELSGRDRLARTFGAISRLRRADHEALLLVAAAELNLRE